MHLARVEKTLYFDSGVFYGVGGVADVFHAADAEVAADGSDGGLRGICGAEEVANGLDGVFAFEHEGEYGAGAHKFNDLWEKGAVGNVRVVFLEEVIGEGDKLGGADFEAGFFKASDDLTGVMAVEAVWFEQNE